MAEDRVQRKLTTILATDVEGYSRLMRADEEATLKTLGEYSKIIDGLIARHDGRVFSTGGDSVLAEFVSAVEAVRCGISIQEEIASRNTELADDRKLMFRIGINIGDVMVRDDDLFGDGVNVAARLEGLAEAGGVCVSGSVHEQVVNKLEARFNDLGPQQVKNIGEPVRAFLIRFDVAAGPPAPGQDDTPPLPDKPSIAVLPFENMSADPEQEYFSDGITEDIITELSKISGLFVIARHSAFTYKGKSVTLKQVGRELGVRCVLEGSVRRVGDRLRITAQLIDAITDHHLWAERYDRDLDDIFAVQDEVARKVAEALEVALAPGERMRLAQVPTQNLEAYEVYLRARKTPYPPTRHNVRSARTAYERVIEMDPAFAGGYAGKSMMLSMAVLRGHSDDREDDTATAFEMAKRAVELDQNFALSHSALGTAHSASGQHEEAVIAAKHAVELQPGDADSHFYYGNCLLEAGLADEACFEGETALRLDPQYVEGPYLNSLARAAFRAERYEETANAYERNAARGGPSYLGSMVVWAAACSLSGQLEKARELVEEMLQERPDLRLDQIPEVRRRINDLELERLQDGLRRAGLPE